MIVPAATRSGPSPMRCVGGGAEPSAYQHAWLDAMQAGLFHALRSLDDRRAIALARLVPALLCGEQSAVIVFHAEAERLERSARLESVRLFRRIEHEEAGHERALQMIARTLPDAPDTHLIKRRAQRFYAQLGRSPGVAQHFSQIAHLDAAVCRIMRELERSALARAPAIGALFGHIKRDEARHVSVSRRHATALGLSRHAHQRHGIAVRERLAGFLNPLGDAFEQLEVDAEALFARLERGGALA